MKRSGHKHTILVILVTLLLIVAAPSVPSTQVARSQATDCSMVVQTAFATTERLCSATGRNEACYGHLMIDARPHPNVKQFDFSEAGDIARVADIQNLRVSAMSDDGSWGVALLRLQGQLANAAPDQNITLLVFGDVELENRVSFSSQISVTAAASTNINIRQMPTTSAPVIGKLTPGQTVQANGRLADSSWLRIESPGGVGFGWVYAPLVTSDDALDTLDVVDTSVARYGPMQAFYFRSGMRDAACQEAPNSGILIQTPEGVAQVNLLINEVDIQLGSTVFFEAEPGNAMTVTVVEGSARVEAMEESQIAYAGSEIRVPLGEDMRPSAPPESPRPYEMLFVESLPVNQLERAITIHEPLTQEEIDANTKKFKEEKEKVNNGVGPQEKDAKDKKDKEPKEDKEGGPPEGENPGNNGGNEGNGKGGGDGNKDKNDKDKDKDKGDGGGGGNEKKDLTFSTLNSRLA